MKLSITQVVLGVLIILASFYVTGWMIHEAPDQYSQRTFDENGKMTWVDVVPQDEVQFSIARYGSYALPLFGIFLVISASVYASKRSPVKGSLAIIAIITGLLTAAMAYIIIRYGYPNTFRAVQPNEKGLLIMFGSMHGGWTVVIRESCSAILFLSGLAVTGINIAQLIKSRKKEVA